MAARKAKPGLCSKCGVGARTSNGWCSFCKYEATKARRERAAASDAIAVQRPRTITTMVWTPGCEVDCECAPCASWRATYDKLVRACKD